jgi:transposase-like protein
MTHERGVSVDHSIANRWAIRFLPLLEKLSRQHKRKVGSSWRMDETYIKVKGAWCYLYRAVDREGKNVDFLLTAQRDMAATRRFFEKARRENRVPGKIVMDRSGANKAAIDEINRTMAVPITVWQVKYLNNIVEQDHCAVKRMTRPMLGFKSFRAAANVLAGVELMHMIRKGRSSLMTRRLCRSPINFMRWRDRSVQRKPGPCLAPKSPSDTQQCDRTAQIRWLRSCRRTSSRQCRRRSGFQQPTPKHQPRHGRAHGPCTTSVSALQV